MSKRSREGTPLKENKFKHLQDKMGKDLEGRLANLTGALGNVKGDKIKDLKDSILEVMKKFVVPVLEAQGTMVSDLISQIIELETRVDEINDELLASKERVRDLENCREKTEVKVSRRDMTEKVAASSKQFKLLDIDFEKEIGDRKELISAAREKVGLKVRSEKRARYEELIRKATVQVLARSTTKRKEQDSDKEIWTAPILFSVDDRENRWELEDLLRQSKVYPTFHWGREMVGLVKEMRSSLKDKYDDKYYVRIRPEEREGKWRIKADVKPKDSNERFRLGATWEIPPMCPDVRKKNPGWMNPTWAQVVAGTQSNRNETEEMED
jgi:hypothetical protein